MKWNEMMKHYLALTHPVAPREARGARIPRAYVTYKLSA